MSSELILWIKKIFIVIAIGTFLYGIYFTWGILFIILISGFLTIIFTPIIEKGEKYRIPSWITLLGIYIIILVLLGIVIGTLIPIIITYVTDTVNAIIKWANTAQNIYMQSGIHGFGFHPYIEKAVTLVLGQNNIEHTLDLIKQNAGSIQSFFTGQISNITSGGFSFVSNLGGLISDWVMVGITTFLMVLERKKIGKYIITSLPPESHKYVSKHYGQIQNVFTSWMKGMLFLSMSIFIITYIGLFLLETFGGFSTGKTFTLALIGGIMEFIPYIGPLLALIPAVIIGLGISWKVAFAITILYIIIQQVENNFLVPYIMSRSLDLSPFFVFIIMLIGGTLGGILGIILAIPIAGIIRVVFDEYRKKSGSTNAAENIHTEKIEKKLTNVRKLIASKISPRK
ncbi:AI-2E family transporter [Candidatus Gracilibacteria bacterium]|nr:AI-2E family transporter [Candidatus Gracilibacteria bacterium]